LDQQLRRSHYLLEHSSLDQQQHRSHYLLEHSSLDQQQHRSPLEHSRWLQLEHSS
jgi:hypothetical protein